MPVVGAIAGDQHVWETETTEDTWKPGRALDKLPNTFYQSSYGSSSPSLTLYFSEKMTVSFVTITNGLGDIDHLRYLEDSLVSVMTESRTVIPCGSVTGVNTESLEEADQTYVVRCNNSQGVGVRVEKILTSKAKAWCIAEIVVQYHLPGNVWRSVCATFYLSIRLYIIKF